MRMSMRLYADEDEGRRMRVGVSAAVSEDEGRRALSLSSLCGCLSPPLSAAVSLYYSLPLSLSTTLCLCLSRTNLEAVYMRGSGMRADLASALLVLC